MALTRRISKRSIILQPSNAEVSTNQTITPYYEFYVNGPLIVPVETPLDSLKHVVAGFTIHQVLVSVKTSGTAQYNLKVYSYDINGGDQQTHVSTMVNFMTDKQMFAIPIADADVGENRTLQLTVEETVAGTSAEDLTVTVISDILGELSTILPGHIIEEGSGATLPQQDILRFGLDFDTSDTPGVRTNINLDKSYLKSILEQTGDIKHSMLTEAQFQTLHGSEWVLMDGRSVVGSDYETVTGNSTVPDGRGIFLRGKNNGRLDGNENLDGDKALGTHESDQFQGHWHEVRATPGNGTVPAGSQNIVRHDWPGDTIQYTPGNQNAVQDPQTDTVNGTPNVGPETRPRSITVNIFIKIN